MYTVTAQRQIPAPVETVWQYLTEPSKLARWFADVEHLAPQAPFQFNFGDGDFFAGSVVEWDSNIVLGMLWKFVGVGPEFHVRYSLLRRKLGTELSIQDRGAITIEEAECLRVGWSEFLMRLEKAIVKDVETRFLWRKAINFTIIVDPAQKARLMSDLKDAQWYENNLSRVQARTQSATENEIRALVTHENWGDAETLLKINLKNIRGIDYLLVAQEGWGGLPASIAESERRSFLPRWLHAVSQYAAG